MVTLQFWRGFNQECLLSIADQTTYKIVALGLPLLSFVSDLDLSFNNCCENRVDKINHVYFGIEELQYGVNLFTVKNVQSFFIKIFDEKIQDGRALDLKMFEEIAIDYGFEVPFHGISKQDMDGKEVICDLYRCFYIKGFTRDIIEQLCVAELHYLTTNGYTIKRCENCGKLFIPQKADEKYCIRRSKEYPNMNCKQAAKYKKQLLRESNNESARIYHSIYTMLAKRCKDASPSSQSQAQKTLLNFADDAKEWKNRIKINPEIESEYIDWLNSFKKRKSKR